MRSAALVAGGPATRVGAPSRVIANVITPAESARLEALQGHKL